MHIFRKVGGERLRGKERFYMQGDFTEPSYILWYFGVIVSDSQLSE